MNPLFALAVAAITAVVFARLVRCSFTTWDDQGTIWANPWINPPTASAVKFYWTTVGERTPGQLFTPVTYTVWAATAAVSDALFGRAPDVDGIRLSPAVFHAANVLLHATAAALAYLLLVRLFGRRWPAVAGALLFSLHPVQVESVGWASGTKDVLCGLFSIAALLAYVTAVRRSEPGGSAAGSPGIPQPPTAPPRPARPRRRRYYLLATSLFLLAMLSKPTAVVVPLMAFTIDVLLLNRPWRSAARWLWPWAVLMVPCVLWTQAAQPAPWASPIALWQRPLVATDALAFYLCKIVWPMRLCIDYGRRPAAVVASGIAYYSWLLPAAVALACSRARPLLAAAGLFVLPLLPVLGLVPFDFQFYSTVADHYLYLPMFGVAVGVTWAIASLGRPAQAKSAGETPVRRFLPAATAAILLALAVRSSLQERTWQDTTAVFTNVLRVNPRSFAACDQMGFVETTLARRIRGDRPTVPPSDPQYAQWRLHLEQSLVWYDRSMERYPGYVPSLLNVAINAGQLGRHDEQRAALRRIVRLQSTLPVGLRADPMELARRLIAAGDPATAVEVLDGILRANPTNLPAAFLRSQAMKR